MISVTLKKERIICEGINDALVESSTKDPVVLGTKNSQVNFSSLVTG